AATSPEHSQKAMVKTTPEPTSVVVSTAEDMVATAPAVADEPAPVLEASTKAATPVLFEKQTLQKVDAPLAHAENSPTITNVPNVEEAAVLAAANERLTNMTKAEKRAFKKE